MQRHRLALAASLVASILAAAPVSAASAFVSPSCVIRDGSTYASTVVRTTPAFGPGATFFNRNDFLMVAQMMELVDGRYYATYAGEKRYVELSAAWADGTTRTLVLVCRPG